MFCFANLTRLCTNLLQCAGLSKGKVILYHEFDEEPCLLFQCSNWCRVQAQKLARTLEPIANFSTTPESVFRIHLQVAIFEENAAFLYNPFLQCTWTIYSHQPQFLVFLPLKVASRSHRSAPRGLRGAGTPQDPRGSRSWRSAGLLRSTPQWFLHPSWSHRAPCRRCPSSAAQTPVPDGRPDKGTCQGVPAPAARGSYFQIALRGPWPGGLTTHASPWSADGSDSVSLALGRRFWCPVCGEELSHPLRERPGVGPHELLTSLATARGAPPLTPLPLGWVAA